MPDILIVILAVVFVLGIAINIHEFGHFMVAKSLGMRVEAYSFFGLGPRIWGFKVGHTDYRISAIPLGAYVKLYGDEATASLEGGESADETVPDSELYELRPRWQKFLVMLGGPFMNIVLALAIPFGAAVLYGVPSMPAPVVGLVSPNGAAEKAGIKIGDRVTSFNGTDNPTWEHIRDETMISPGKSLPLVVDRGGQPLTLNITPEKKDLDGNGVGEVGMRPDAGVEPVEALSLVPGSPAESSGIVPGDKVMAYNGETVRNGDELTARIRANKDAAIRLTIDRNGERKELVMQPRLDSDGVYRIGGTFGASDITTRVPVGIMGAAAYAVDTNLRIIRLTGRVFGQLFAGERSVKDAGLAGPVGIVQIISKVVRDAGFGGLVLILGVISLNLGVFNLLPIPLLDGGQIMVLGIEKVMSWFGRTLSLAWKERIQLTGLAVILLLMVFTLFLDISKFF
ncbi:MAG: RIP metalloprotease RseP [Acidobacteriota bacterium]